MPMARRPAQWARRLYLNLTGLGCYHKKDVPAWYDALGEEQRWAAQAAFWEAVARRCANSPAVFCYDLMNEPVVPGGKRAAGDWLGPAFGGKHFVQFVTLDQKNRPRPDVARMWTEHLVAAVRKVDARHLVTVGLVDWSLDRPGLTSGFVPDKVCAKLDFVSVHLYPEAGKVGDAAKTLKGFAVSPRAMPVAFTTAELVVMLVALLVVTVGAVAGVVKNSTLPKVVPNAFDATAHSIGSGRSVPSPSR